MANVNEVGIQLFSSITKKIKLFFKCKLHNFQLKPRYKIRVNENKNSKSDLEFGISLQSFKFGIWDLKKLEFKKF